MDVTEKTPEEIARETGEQIARTINILEQGLLRARAITGTRLRRTTETPLFPVQPAPDWAISSTLSTTSHSTSWSSSARPSRSAGPPLSRTARSPRSTTSCALPEKDVG